jgi:hypothetical protein
MASFWAGGTAAYAEGLEKHYESRLRELRVRQRSAAEGAEPVLIREEIERTTAEYQEKCKQMKWLIF